MVLQSEHANLLPSSYHDAQIENGPTETKQSGNNSNNKIHAAILITGIVLLEAFLLSSLYTSKSPSGSSANTPFQGKEWDTTMERWEAALYHSHHHQQHNDGIELLGKSKKAAATTDDELIYFNHTKAFDMLKTNTDHDSALDFYYYQQGWDAQINQAYCGVATSAAFMNSLRGIIELPQDPIYMPFPWATQNQLIVNQCVRETVYDIDKMQHVFFGIGLDMAVQLLNCNLASQGYKATGYHVDPQTTPKKLVREAILAALQDKNSRVAINYDRGGIGQGDMGHGHFSPIAAYNHEKDAFLVMDVAKYKYPPVWVPTSRLLGGIGTMDQCAYFRYPESPPDFEHTSLEDIVKNLGCQPAFRGYMIISPLDE